MGGTGDTILTGEGARPPGHPLETPLDFGTNQKRVWDFVLTLNSGLGPTLHRFIDIRAFFTSKTTFSTPHPYPCKNCVVFPLE